MYQKLAICCTAPAAAPQNLMKTTVLSTSITVGWDPVECIERNGVIHNYTLQFGPECGLQSESTVQSRGIAVAGIYNASGLTPFTRYSFEVAAVNSAGTGPFTATLIVETSGNWSTLCYSFLMLMYHSTESTHWSDGCSRWSHQCPGLLDCTSLRLLCHHWLPHHLHQ